MQPHSEGASWLEAAPNTAPGSSQESDTAAYSGQLRRAEQLTTRAFRRLQVNNKETAACGKLMPPYGRQVLALRKPDRQQRPLSKLAPESPA